MIKFAAEGQEEAIDTMQAADTEIVSAEEAVKKAEEAIKAEQDLVAGAAPAEGAASAEGGEAMMEESPAEAPVAEESMSIEAGTQERQGSGFRQGFLEAA